jgi:hypothetical protein
MRGGAGGERGGAGSDGGTGGVAGAVVGNGTPQASSGTVHTPQLSAQRSLSSWLVQSSVPIWMTVAQSTSRWRESSSLMHVFGTQGAAGLGGGVVIVHSVVVPSLRTMCHGAECGSLSVSLCM